MFTGLIEEIGVVQSISSQELKIRCCDILIDSKLGDSISVNGVCLSIIKIQGNILSFHVSPTTMQHSRFTPGGITSGEEVNLERALRVSERLDGHIVTGHIDGMAKLIAITKQGSDSLFELLIPPNLKSLVIKKGSIAIDGISLTIADVKTQSFVLAIIPQTLEKTNLKKRKIGDMVHVEADVFARYVQHVILHSERKFI